MIKFLSFSIKTCFTIYLVLITMNDIKFNPLTLFPLACFMMLDLLLLLLTYKVKQDEEED
jgi:hypothetical protein